MQKAVTSMTSSTVSALPQQSEAERITECHASGETISCASLDSSVRSPVVLAHIHPVCAGTFFNTDYRLCRSAGSSFGVNRSATLRHYRTARRIKHSAGLSSEARHGANCAISDSGVARHAQILGSAGPDDGENADGSFHEKRVHTR
jgi:hypothetical protein